MDTKEIRAKIDKLKKRLREAERHAREERNRAWRVMMKDQDSWEWRVIPTEYRSFGNGTISGVRIEKRLRPEVAVDWPELVKEKDWRGIFYARTREGILHHRGGGDVVLETPRLCSDQEWSDLVAGRIPQHFFTSVVWEGQQ